MENMLRKGRHVMELEIFHARGCMLLNERHVTKWKACYGMENMLRKGRHVTELEIFHARGCMLLNERHVTGGEVW